MATIINHSAGTLTPVAVSSWESSVEVRTIVHHILGRTDPDVTLRPASMRQGTLTLTFDAAAAATAARSVLELPQLLTLVSAEVPEVGMSFVVANGSIGEVLGAAGQWTITVPFQEVSV
ncbi:hypothetical protein FGL91_14810 [Microbacterium sp. CBA3102]|uniref:hypothetical protein n=1 Tax=Microbacterium sp. CBA3102 TaxID=2603598 RepID=UPI0011BBBC6C|nr:hypothetical protein [Microbacterium sp. CBA3102]QEA29707.1 hypothetical protein FGL91_14810 [Microbacterium sp. CBA3102]